MTLPASLAARLRIPMIATPVLRVSGPELAWLTEIADLVDDTARQYAEATRT